MFEKYSESARRCVFFARYEAARFGSAQIEIEHLLLGILRIDSELALRLLGSPERLDAIRDQIGKQLPAPQKGVSTSADLPLSPACRSALDLAAKESEELQHTHIGPEHLLLGISRDESSAAGRTLGENGLAH